MYRLLSVIFTFVISASAFAHEGHDHSAPSAGLIHFLWLAPLVIGAIALIVYIVKSQSAADD